MNRDLQLSVATEGCRRAATAGESGPETVEMRCRRRGTEQPERETMGCGAGKGTLYNRKRWGIGDGGRNAMRRGPAGSAACGSAALDGGYRRWRGGNDALNNRKRRSLAADDCGAQGSRGSGEWGGRAPRGILRDDAGNLHCGLFATSRAFGSAVAHFFNMW